MSQRDPRWASHELGWGPPEGNTIGAIGCLETDYAMICWDSFGDMHYNPDTLNNVFKSRRIYVQDPDVVDFDLLPDNALDLVWPQRFKSTTVQGWPTAAVAGAVASPDVYVIAHVVPPGISHFVIIASSDGRIIADPWTGKYGLLASYGGPGSVAKVDFVHKLNPPAVPAPSTPQPVPVPPPINSGLTSWDRLEDIDHQVHEGGA